MLFISYLLLFVNFFPIRIFNNLSFFLPYNKYNQCSEYF